MTRSEAVRRDRETFAGLETLLPPMPAEAAAHIRALMLRAYDLGCEDTRHEITILTRRGRDFAPCGCAECTAPA